MQRHAVRFVRIPPHAVMVIRHKYVQMVPGQTDPVQNPQIPRSNVKMMVTAIIPVIMAIAAPIVFKQI